MDTMDDSKDEKVFVCTSCYLVFHNLPEMMDHQSHCPKKLQQSQLQHQQPKQQQHLQPPPHSPNSCDLNTSLPQVDPSCSKDSFVCISTSMPDCQSVEPDCHSDEDSIDVNPEITEHGDHTDTTIKNSDASGTGDCDDQNILTINDLPNTDASSTGDLVEKDKLTIDTLPDSEIDNGNLVIDDIPKANTTGTRMVSLLDHKIHSMEIQTHVVSLLGLNNNSTAEPKIQSLLVVNSAQKETSGKLVSLLGKSKSSTPEAIKLVIPILGLDTNSFEANKALLQVSKPSPLGVAESNDNGLNVELENDFETSLNDDMGACIGTTTNSKSSNYLHVKLENDMETPSGNDIGVCIGSEAEGKGDNGLNVKLENDSVSEDISDTMDNGNLEFSMFHCVPCGHVFNEETLFREHPCKASKKIKTYTCGICHKSFKKRSIIYAHMKIHYCSKEHECKICSKAFLHKHQLVTHEISHTDHRPFKCETCSKSFKRNSHLDKHRLTHTGKKAYSCDKCDYKGVCAYDVRRHFKKIHTADRSHKCTLCPSAFTENYKLLGHMKKVHGPGGKKKESGKSQRSYVKCLHCEKIFYWRKHLAMHMESDHPEVFNSLDIKQEVPDDYEESKGEDDDYSPGSSKTLRHRTHGQESVDKTKCWFCDMTFSREAGLIRHMKGKHKSEYKEVKMEEDDAT